jgi:hypothetical protein
MPPFIPHFGYVPDPAHTERYVESLPFPRLADDLPHLIRQRTPRDVFLWLPLLKVKPSWQRGAQGIGDCVAWGAELAATFLMAMQHVAGESGWVEEAATEAIYGGCRVEALGKRLGGYEDGAAGSWAAEWLGRYGVLCRVDYAQQTGNAEHDLRQYSAQRAKQWGHFGCGGSSDKGALDSVAKQHPIHAYQVHSIPSNQSTHLPSPSSYLVHVPRHPSLSSVTLHPARAHHRPAKSQSEPPAPGRKKNGVSAMGGLCLAMRHLWSRLVVTATSRDAGL